MKEWQKEETKSIQITIVKTLLMSNIINHFMHGRNYEIVNEVVYIMGKKNLLPLRLIDNFMVEVQMCFDKNAF